MVKPRLSEDLRDELKAIAADIASDFALTIFDLSVAQQRKGWQIRLILDKLEGFVTVEDCALVSKRLQARIELEQLLPPDDYTMEVSSPGLNRPLRGEADYRRFLGSLARFTVRSAEGGRAVMGRIIVVANGTVTLLSEEESVEVALGDIKEARLVPEGPGFDKGNNPKKRRK